jgi:hypothetical protein
LTGLLAHGLVQRANLPLPEELFFFAGAVVLAVSFAALGLLWSRPRLEHDEWHPLPYGIGRALGSRAVEIACGALGFFLLVVAIVAGYVGPIDPLSNFTPVFVLIIFWVGLAFASVLFGDVFHALNPWRAAARAVRLRGRREYPEKLGLWPAAAGLFIFTWIELASGWGEHPARLATAIVVYSVITWIGMALFGVEAWTRRGEAFGVYFNLLSRLSIFEKRGHEVGRRPLLGGLPSLERPPGTIAFVCVMIGTVTFDGLSQGSLWRDISTSLFDTLGTTLTDTIGLLLGVALVAGFYRLGMAGARTVGGDFESNTLARSFVHSLVPIAAVYVAAHYLTFLIFEGQAIRYTASDPFGQGWDLFGWAQDGIDYSLLSQNATWYLQVTMVVAGHVAALVLAHDRALVIYRQPGMAVRSQIWMLGIMIGFTGMALWLLARAGA